MKKIMTLLVLGAGSGLAGCASVTPYDSDFSCKSDDYGQCIHPAGAYALATASTAPTVEAIDTGANAPGVEPVNRRQRKRRDRSRRASGDGADLLPVSVTPYEGYQQAVYREVAGLVEQPVTPMLTKPKVVRTLIMPYAGRGTEDVLYMPRYVYTMLEGPRFVMGDYLNQAQPDDMASQLARGAFGTPPSADDEAEDAAPTRAPTRLRRPAPSETVADEPASVDPLASLGGSLDLGPQR